MSASRTFLHAALALPVLCWSLIVPANDQRQIAVELTVAAAPCAINNGAPVEVAFGNDLLTSRVAGGTYRQTIDYNARCTAPHLKTGITGNSASFDTTLLATSNSALGIQFIINRVSQPLNTWRNLNDAGGSAALPVLEAVLVKKPGASLAGGKFTASATLRIEYQ